MKFFTWTLLMMKYLVRIILLLIYIAILRKISNSTSHLFQPFALCEKFQMIEKKMTPEAAHIFINIEKKPYWYFKESFSRFSDLKTIQLHAQRNYLSLKKKGSKFVATFLHKFQQRLHDQVSGWNTRNHNNEKSK